VTAQAPTAAGGGEDEGPSSEAGGDAAGSGSTTDPVAADTPPSGATDTRSGEISREEGPATTDASTPETEARPAEPPQPPPTGASGLSADEASEMLQRMEFALEPSTYGLPDTVRAYAAFVLAQRWGDAGNKDESLIWARRATVLDPANESYALFLQLAGGVR
jgi:hypothetical protein